MTNADCIVDSFDPEVSPKNKRQLTVSYVRRLPDRRLVPALIMKGEWLAAAGFDRHPGGGAGDGGLYRADGG